MSQAVQRVGTILEAKYINPKIKGATGLPVSVITHPYAKEIMQDN